MSALCSCLPDPSDSLGAWAQAMVSDPQRWANAVRCIFFTESQCDLGTGVVFDESTPVVSFACSMCSSAFASDKALQSHARTKHGVKVPQRLFCLPDGTCQACGTYFRSHLRLLPHLCDSRRTGCWDRICASPTIFSKLSKGDCAKLDCTDNVKRREARRAGHSHPLAVGQAHNAKGVPVGVARQSGAFCGGGCAPAFVRLHHWEHQSIVFGM